MRAMVIRKWCDPFFADITINFTANGLNCHQQEQDKQWEPFLIHIDVVHHVFNDHMIDSFRQ